MKKVLVLVPIVLALLVAGGRAVSAGTCVEFNDTPPPQDVTVCVP